MSQYDGRFSRTGHNRFHPPMLQVPKSHTQSSVLRDCRWKLKYLYTNGAKCFKRSAEDLKTPWDPSTPYIHETNAVIERCNRRIKEGASCLLVQSGLSPEWWPEAVCCFNFQWNVSEIMKGGQTPYENDSIEKFKDH